MIRGPPGGVTGQRICHRTREVCREGLAGTDGEVNVGETEETLRTEGVSVLKVIFVDDPPHSPPLPSRGHSTPVNIKSQTLV